VLCVAWWVARRGGDSRLCAGALIIKVHIKFDGQQDPPPLSPHTATRRRETPDTPHPTTDTDRDRGAT